MNYKLLVLDLDGTLLSDQHIISEKNIKAIEAAQKKGVKVVIATGRLNAAVEKYLAQIGVDNYLITYNGALIKNIKTDTIINHFPVSLNLTADILEFVERNNLYVNLYLDGEVYANKTGAEREYYEEIMGIEPTLIKGDLLSFVDKPPTKILIIEKDINKANKCMDKLKNSFSDQLSITNSLAECIDIMNKGVSKGSALKELAKRLEISSQQIMAIGDQPNDLEMINYAGRGIAVANAEESLKAAADYVTDSNNQSGVAAAIEKFI